MAQQPPWPQHGGPGAVAREGIAALDVRNGLPLSWNPGRSRGVGVFNLYSDGEGLWMASDTQLAGGEFHGRLAYFPAAGGVSLPPEHTVELPGAVQLVNTWTGSRYRIGASYRWLTTSGVTGATVDIGDSTGWSGVRGATMVDARCTSPPRAAACWRARRSAPTSRPVPRLRSTGSRTSGVSCAR